MDPDRVEPARTVAVLAAFVTAAAWGLWRLGRSEWIFGLSTDDHARILAAWALRDGGLAAGDVWAPLPTLVTGAALLAIPSPHVVPGLVNLAWAGLAVYAVARIAGSAGSAGAILAAGLLGGSVWFGWLANSALAEPPYVALLALAALALVRSRTRRDAWLAVLPAALAGACRYEAWAAVAILPALAAGLPGPRRVLVAQGAALLAFPVAWMVYHGLANGDPLGFLHTVMRAATSDPHLSDVSRVATDLTACAGSVIGLGVAVAVFAPPRGEVLRGLGLLVGVELAVVCAQLLGVAGVHNGPRNHVVLLAALCAGIGAAMAGIEPGRRRRFATVALAVHLGLQLPRAGQPPAAHAEEVEQVARAAAGLLGGEGWIVIDVDDDEEAAFKALIGVPDRVRYAREDEAIVLWREATGRMDARASPSRILEAPDVLAVVTSQPRGDATVVTEAGPYALLTRGP